MWETEDGVELNCNMRGVIGSRGLRLFIIQYGWLSDEARGERERESEQKRSRWRYGALCSSPACWKCDFLFLFFFFFCHFMSSYYTGYWGCQRGSATLWTPVCFNAMYSNSPVRNTTFTERKNATFCWYFGHFSGHLSRCRYRRGSPNWEL